MIGKSVSRNAHSSEVSSTRNTSGMWEQENKTSETAQKVKLTEFHLP